MSKNEHIEKHFTAPDFILDVLKQTGAGVEDPDQTSSSFLIEQMSV
jgi:hypothetical protein